MKVSIITVCFNSVTTIEDCLLSIFRQSYPHIELIVIDGLSTDGTRSILDKYHQKIAKIVAEKDNGIYDAMNKGISHSSGEIIGFLNSDDLFHDDFVVENIVEKFIGSKCKIVYGDLIYTEFENTAKIVRYWKARKFKKCGFSKGWNPPHPTFYCKKSVYEICGTFNDKYNIAADIDFMLRATTTFEKSIRYLPQILVKMRMGGVTNKSYRNILLQNYQVVDSLRQNNVRFNIFVFIFGKILNRIKQYLTKPNN